MRTAVLALAAVLATSATAYAGDAVIIPPLEVDTGIGGPIGGGAAVTGVTTEVLAGVHWASLAWRPTKIDIGVGYVGSFRDVIPGYATRIVESSPMASGANNELRLDGGYLELGHTLAGSTRHWRTWIAARGELLHGSVGESSFSAFGEAVRVSSEIYASGAATGGGAIVGTFALGVYVEAAHRELSPELGPNSLTSGITVRVPFMAGG
jgi:hypothetical protein